MASRKECVSGEEEENKHEREHVIASALFSFRRRRSLLCDCVFLCLRDSLSSLLPSPIHNRPGLHPAETRRRFDPLESHPT
jgi:hypothetical protein